MFINNLFILLKFFAHSDSDSSGV